MSKYVNGTKYHDHRMISCSLDSVSTRSSTKQSSYRDIKKLDMDLFRSELLVSPVFQSPAEAVDDYVDQIESSVLFVLDKLAPIKTGRVKQKGHNVKNWISTDALAAKRNRRKLERRWKRTGDVNDRIEYRGACRQANRLIRKSSRKFFEDRIHAVTLSKDGPQSSNYCIQGVLRAHVATMIMVPFTSQ